ncbi:serine hydrolase domain-containing protein [Leeuwenhoekiella sp. NPDC079379]|uniref:serine hydrolase domain-containing protein n=1 Tax=Leeuwenhoekiella sp. NPDC079379 TaxID=3364122 RepID=UPI0037C60F33
MNSQNSLKSPTAAVNEVGLSTTVSQQEKDLFQLRKAAINLAIADYFKQAIDQHLIIGAGVSVISGDSILFNGGFGMRSFSKLDSVNAQTVFRLGSLSKGFTGVLASIEVEEGNISWEDKLATALPQFHLKNKLNEQAITLSNVLSHTTGVPYHCYTNLVEAGLTMSQIAERFGVVNTISKPGDLYSYQNAMFALSGEMMQVATGQSIQQLLQNKIFTPLNMKTASTDYDAMISTDNYAFPHKNTAKGWMQIPVNKKYYNAVPAGGVNASAEDMAKWMRFLLGHEESVLTKSGLKTVFTPQIEMLDGRKYYQRWKGHLKSSYAFGWRIHDFIDAKTGAQTSMVHHGGSVSNFRNEIALYPAEDLGVCVLFNSMTPLATSVIPELHDIIKNIMNTPASKFGLSELVSL